MKNLKKIIISALLILLILASAIIPGISAFLSKTETHTGTMTIDETYFTEVVDDTE